MDRDDLRQVMEKLEAIAALSTLFKNLWYEKIKREAGSEKVRAYLTVYEDAVPHLNQLLEYAHHSASLLADGKLDQDKYERLQMAFGQLAAGLLGRDVDSESEMPGIEELESSVEFTAEQEAEMEEDFFEPEEPNTATQGRRNRSDDLILEGVSQAEVEALLVDTQNGTTGNIDSLFENHEQSAPTASQEEIDALLEEPDTSGGSDDLDELLGEEVEVAAEEPEIESAAEGSTETAIGDLGTDEELGDLLDSLDLDAEDEAEVEGAGEDLDLGDGELADTESAEEGVAEAELDLEDLEMETGDADGEGDLDLEVETAEEDGLDLSELDLGDTQDESSEVDLADLLDDDKDGEVSDADLDALLNGDGEEEAEEEPEPPKPAPRATPSPKTVAKPTPKAAPAPKAAAPAPKALPKAEPKAAPAPKAAVKPAPKAAPAKNNNAEEDSISQDEIDALFG